MIDHFFGTVIMAMTALQAGLGWYHHKRFQEDKPSQRRWFTHTHIWLGRTTILAGMINCGFGLILAQPKLKWVIFWGVGCGVLITIYIGIVLMIRNKAGKGAPRIV
jgi:hypothetical protein